MYLDNSKIKEIISIAVAGWEIVFYMLVERSELQWSYTTLQRAGRLCSYNTHVTQTSAIRSSLLISQERIWATQAFNPSVICYIEGFDPDTLAAFHEVGEFAMHVHERLARRTVRYIQEARVCCYNKWWLDMYMCVCALFAIYICAPICTNTLSWFGSWSNPVLGNM